MSTARTTPLISVAIVEDNRYMRAGWRALLEGADDMVVLGDYDRCETALESGALDQADVVLMDIGLPGISGIEGVAVLRERNPAAAVVMCTVHEDDDHIFDAICAGAVGYLLKKTPPDELLKAIRDAAGGGSPMTPSIARKVIGSFHTPNGRETRTELTPRERETLEALAQGKSYKTVGEELGITVNGVRHHIRGIYDKLQVHSKSEAIARGLKERLIRPPR